MFFRFFFIRKNARNLWQNYKNNKNIRIATNWFNQFIRLFPSFYWLTWLQFPNLFVFRIVYGRTGIFFRFNWRFWSYKQLMRERKRFPRVFELRICKAKTEVNLSFFCAADSLYVHPKHQWWCTTLFILTRISFICGKILTG